MRVMCVLVCACKHLLLCASKLCTKVTRTIKFRVTAPLCGMKACAALVCG